MLLIDFAGHNNNNDKIVGNGVMERRSRSPTRDISVAVVCFLGDDPTSGGKDMTGGTMERTYHCIYIGRQIYHYRGWVFFQYDHSVYARCVCCCVIGAPSM